MAFLSRRHSSNAVWSAFCLGLFPSSYLPHYFAVFLDLGNYETDATTDKIGGQPAQCFSNFGRLSPIFLEVILDTDSESLEQKICRLDIWENFLVMPCYCLRNSLNNQVAMALSICVELSVLSVSFGSHVPTQQEQFTFFLSFSGIPSKIKMASNFPY